MAKTTTKKKSEPSGAVEQRYRAPALDKGLDVLEMLAKESHPLTVSEISQKLGRSMSELFRMIQVLEYRGFIVRAENGDGFIPTDKLFSLGMDRPPVKSLLEHALPEMRVLATAIGQSCHLAVRSGNDIVVVARMESPEQIGFTVRIGYRRSLAFTGSGAILFAYQHESDQARWLAQMQNEVEPKHVAELQKNAALIRSKGYWRIKSSFMTGVTDLSAPVLRGATAAAALTVPFITSTPLLMPIEEAARHLCAAAARMSAKLLVSDHRV
jgi:DNA-binding IclR family transcriptional regulator